MAIHCFVIHLRILIFVISNLRRGKKERQSRDDTLDDIFGKSSKSKNIFAKQAADDDLFSFSATSSSNAAGNLNQDDITRYINDNLNSEAADLGL